MFTYKEIEKIYNNMIRGINMNEKVKPIIIDIIAVILVITMYTGFQSYREASLLKTMKNTLYKYFKENNTHISSHNFSIDDVKIQCKGRNAYIVEFDILFDNKSNGLNDFGATIYKENNKWNVKNFGTGITKEELKLYRFRCYK
jgi:hypothetical protein